MTTTTIVEASVNVDVIDGPLIAVDLLQSGEVSVEVIEQPLTVELSDSEIINVVISETGLRGLTGAAGSSSGLSGPSFTYTGDALTRIDYDDGSYKTLSYSGGYLSVLDFHRFGETDIIRKTFSYSLGKISQIEETII